MEKSKVTSQSLSDLDDGCVPACTWRSSRCSSPWHGASQDQQLSVLYLLVVTFCGWQGFLGV